MKKFLKIVGIGFLVLLVGFIGLGFYLGDSVDGMYQEVQVKAEAFAATATKDDCLVKYATDYKSCSEISCYSETAMFGAVCLSAASGDSAQFCADKPKSQSEVYKSEWKNDFCKNNGLDTQDCVSVYKIIDTHCSG